MPLDFKELTLADQKLFHDYLRRFPPQASELNFGTLFCWRGGSKYAYQVYEEHLLVSGRHNEKHVLYQPIGANPELIIRKILSENPQLVFARIEQVVAQTLSSDFVVKHERNGDDYLYKVADLKAMEGRKYDGKRNFIKRCKAFNPEVLTLNASLIPACRELHERWCQEKDCDGNRHMSAEREALKEFFANYTELDSFGITVFINGRLSGFAIGETLNSDTFVEHYEKADTEYPGIYPFLVNELANHLSVQFVYLNREQDLGEESLRKSKLSYHPVGLVEKYTVKAASS